MSAISGTIGAYLGSKEQRRATEQNARNVQETNAMNYKMFREGRGSEGNAFLPIYFGGFENEAANDAMTAYRRGREMLGTPEEQATRYRQIVEHYAPDRENSDKFISSIFNGDLTKQRMDQASNVAAARTGLAQGQKQGILEGLSQRLNALSAGRQRAGFTGGSSFDRNRMLEATIGANQAAANALGSANLANTQDTQRIFDEGINLQLAEKDTPYNRALQRINLMELPIDLVQSNVSRNLRPFEFFGIGTGNFQASPLPTVQPNTSAAQIALAAMGQGNQAAANYFLNQQQNRQAQNAYQNYQVGSTLGNMYSSGAVGGASAYGSAGAASTAGDLGSMMA